MVVLGGFGGIYHALGWYGWSMLWYGYIMVNMNDYGGSLYIVWSSLVSTAASPSCFRTSRNRTYI